MATTAMVFFLQSPHIFFLTTTILWDSCHYYGAYGISMGPNQKKIFYLGIDWTLLWYSVEHLYWYLESY